MTPKIKKTLRQIILILLIIGIGLTAVIIVFFFRKQSITRTILNEWDNIDEKFEEDLRDAIQKNSKKVQLTNQKYREKYKKLEKKRQKQIKIYVQNRDKLINDLNKMQL